MFKKLALLIAIVALAGSAYAAGTDVTGATTWTSGAAAALKITGFNQSSGVTVGYHSANSAGTGTTADVYSIATKHLSGTKKYGSSNASTYIWVLDSASGTDLATTDVTSVPATPSDSSILNGFSAL